MSEERAGAHGAEEQAAEAAFERDLVGALRPLQLPAGFAERLEARRAEQGETPAPATAGRMAKVLPFRTLRVVGGGAIAAMLLAGVFAAEDVRQHREQAQRRALATQQFETANRITAQALAHTREELERAGALKPD